jgi:hypothetical protein
MNDVFFQTDGDDLNIARNKADGERHANNGTT